MSLFDRVTDWLLDHPMTFFLTVAVLAVIFGFIVSQTVTPDRDRPCSAFENTAVKNLPARCITYWENR